MLVPEKKLEDSFVSDDEGHALCGLVEESQDKNVPRFFDDGSIPNAKSGLKLRFFFRGRLLLCADQAVDRS